MRYVRHVQNARQPWHTPHYSPDWFQPVFSGVLVLLLSTFTQRHSNTPATACHTDTYTLPDHLTLN